MPISSREGRLATLVDSHWFSMVIASVIVLNAVILGLETYPSLMQDYGDVLVALNQACYAVFVVELILRIASYGRRPQDFFRSGWNVFDAVIVLAVVVPGVREQAQILRLLRLARIARLLRFLPDARILVRTVVKSIPSAFSMVVLTALLLFVYAMVGWSLFGEELPETWGNASRSMLTLFILLTLENLPVYLAEAEQVSSFAPLFFVSFVVLASFIVFNLLIGIVIGSMDSARKEDEQDSQPIASPDGPDGDLAQKIRNLRVALDECEKELATRDSP